MLDSLDLTNLIIIGKRSIATSQSHDSLEVQCCGRADEDGGIENNTMLHLGGRGLKAIPG